MEPKVASTGHFLSRSTAAPPDAHVELVAPPGIGRLGHLQLAAHRRDILALGQLPVRGRQDARSHTARHWPTPTSSRGLASPEVSVRLCGRKDATRRVHRAAPS